MSIKGGPTMRKTTAITAALALMATPAFAQGQGQGQGGQDQGQGQSTAPGQICKNESRKKTNHGKGKSPFAACVVGVKRVNAEVAREGSDNDVRAPGQICRDQSRRKSETDKKSPFAACVTGAAKAKQRHES
jgi:hypothetical protein